jgi:hypothetical protein
MEEYINDAGELYTIEEINQAAEDNKTTFEDIIKRNKLSLKSKKTKPVEEVIPQAPGKPKPVVKKDAVAAVKSTASKLAKPSSVSSNNPFYEEIKPYDPLGLNKLRNAPATKKPVKTTTPTSTNGVGYKYDSRGYLVPSDTKEPSLWDDVKDFAKSLFPDSEEDNNGKLTYYDQTPIKEQQAAFNKDSKDAMNATGKFGFLKDYKPEDRALFISKLVPKTNYTEKRYNQDTDSYYIAPKQEAVDYIMQDIDPSKFKTKAQLDNAIALNTKKLASQDKAFEFEQQYAQAKAAPLIESKIAEIKKKYTLDTPEAVAKATKELQDYAAKTTSDFLVNSSGFQNLNQAFASVESEAGNILGKQYGRSKEGELSFFDKQEKIGTALEKQGGLTGIAGTVIKGVGQFAEGAEKGFINIGQAAKQSLVSTNHGQIADLNNIYSSIKDKSDNAPIDKSFAYNWENNELSTYDPKEQDVPKTYGEAKSRLKKYLDKTKSLINDRVTSIADTKEYLGLFNQADLKDGVQLKDVFQLVGEQTPNLVTTAAGAVTGNPLLIGLSAANMFTQTYGDEYYGTIETGLQEELGRKPTNEELANAVGEGKYANRAEAAAWSALSASLEYASELNIIKNTGKALGIGNDAKTVMGSLLRGEIKNFSKSVLQSGKNIAQSSLGEYLTESVQQAIDQTSKGLQLYGDASKYINIKEINEAGKAGGLVGAVFPFVGTIKTQTGIELRASATKVATMFDLSSANMANRAQVDKFFNEASKNIEERFKVGDLTQEQKQTELETLGTIRSAGVKIPSEFASEAKEKALGLMLEKANIEKAIDGKDKDLVTPEAERLKDISLELATIAIGERERIRIDTNKETLGKSIESIGAIVDKEGNKVYENAIGSGKSVEVFETTAEAQTAYDKWALENNEKQQDITKSDGFALPNGQILVNKERAAQVGALNVAPHELLHNILKSEFSDPKRKIELKDKFLSVLSKSERTKLDERILAVNENGERLYSDQDLEAAPDEYMTQYFELLGNGTITWSDNVKETLLNLWNSVIKPIFIKQGFKNIEFEDGRDIYNFIKDYSKSIKKGQISERASSLLKAGEGISGATKMSKTKSETLKEQLNELEDNEGDYDPDDFDQQVASLKAQIKRAIDKEKTEVKPIIKKEVTEEDTVKEIINNEKGTISSDKVQKIYNEKGLNGAKDIIDLFKPITKKIVDKRRDAPGFDRELLTDEIETGSGGILDLIRSYNASKGVPLAAYINKQLPLRAIASSKRLLDESFSKDVTEEKGLMAAETVLEVKEKPKYKNALESKVFSPEVLESANKKILSVVRTLKSKINAPISLNKTVTPLISEIRDEIGKQLDIDVKTAMGGKKDNQLQNWLLDNKQYVLENMTTTWLMGKDGQGGMPIAIQKQINNKWVNFPDWVGKKIDREKTSTDNAGRTSGAELVRRLPNVNNNISDSQFLDQVIGPDGNPLRGRKESLAKAIAEESAFDIINNDFENEGPIFDAFKANQERLGVELIDNVATEISRQIERGNVKFSITKDDFRQVTSDLFHAASDFGIESKEVETILNKLPLDERELAKEYVFGDYIDLVAKLQNIKAGVRGTAYENIILKELKKLKLNGVKVINTKAQGFDSTGSGDINIQLGKDILNIEVKLNKLAQMGSFSMEFDPKNGSFSPSQKIDGLEELSKKLKSKLSSFEAYSKAAEDLGVETSKWPYKITKEQHAILKTKGFQKNLTASVDIDQKVIEQLYNNKDVHYINIGKNGLFSLGQDILNLGVPQLSSKVKLTARLVRGGDYNRIRVFPTLIDFNQRSKYNIDNAASNNALFTRYKQNLAIKQSKTTEDAVVKSLDPKFSKTQKGISVFDFDDTVGLTKSNVLYTMPDGTKGKLNAEEFAKEGSKLLSEGAIFDFSEFSKVTNGKPGPMVEKMKKMIGKFGPENFFILTARPADSAGPIHEFLKSIGIEIPLKNITGLGNSAAQAKADWITAKAAEGYNDFYFADDAIQNVTAVKNALEVLDVKSKIQQARAKFSKTISPEFNKIIEENTGMADYKVFSDIVARRRGADKNKFDFYVPPSAADFELLLYNFIGKGKRGEEQQKFFADALLKPYANGNDLMDAARQSIKKDYKALTDQFPDIKNKIEKLTPDGDFTYDQAIRVAMWTEEGVEIPGISQRDQTKLTDLVNNDPELNAFKQGLIVTGRQGRGWIIPTEYWDASTIISDLHNLTEGEGRKKFLAEFIDNAQEMFGKWENGKLVGPNINKVEAVYGTNVREAIEDVLYRMTTGKNRSQGKDKETSAWASWVNGSTGTIMFLNTRSAALQLIGAVNFLNLRDNNLIAAGKAFANQKQYWEDFALIWNSDKMKERRGGLKEDVAAAEIANAAAGSKNKVNSVISYLLKIGYTPTQLADSFAIASGGSPFYRNRIKSYLKEGLTQDEAQTAAWSDFTKVSDETQQSGDPRDISKQQASGAGRLLLTFQNTAMQQSRIVKKSFLDLKNGRGDAKTHIAKITYYLAIQNLMFSVLQQGLFAVLFSGDDKDDEEAKKKKAKELDKKYISIADGVLDTILRGTGFVGGITATLKNMYLKYNEEKEKDFKADYAKVVLEGANISPPIGSKLRKLYSGFQQTKFEKDLIKERGWGVMQDGRLHLGPLYGVTGKVIEATTNVPMDRLVNKIENVSQAMNSKNTALQRLMIGIGFSPYSTGVEDTEGDLEIRTKAKEIRKEEGKIKARETRIRTKDSIMALPIEERMKLKRDAALKRREEKLKKRKRKMG